jgi:obg-like ATPase 1
VNVPDERYEWLVNFHKPLSRVPAALSITDIAGLIRGASKGEGLGNAFLSHIHQVDGIFHVVRIFDDEDVTHVEGSIDPVRDLDIITEELLIKDLAVASAAKDRLERELHHKKDKKKLAELEVVVKVEQLLQEKKQIRLVEWKATELDAVNNLSLLTAKPVVYVINMADKDFIKKGSKWLGKIKAWVDAHGGEPMVPFCCALENKWLTMSDDEKKVYQQENKVSSSVGKLITTGYHALDLIHFFTCGPDEVKCWTIRRTTKAPGAAGVIHTDFERGFICAEVMKFEEFKELGSESAVKAAGKYRQEGKTYSVCDGDIVFFKANTAGLKK